jgi:hypothetical protein
MGAGPRRHPKAEAQVEAFPDGSDEDGDGGDAAAGAPLEDPQGLSDAESSVTEVVNMPAPAPAAVPIHPEVQYVVRQMVAQVEAEEVAAKVTAEVVAAAAVAAAAAGGAAGAAAGVAAGAGAEIVAPPMPPVPKTRAEINAAKKRQAPCETFVASTMRLRRRRRLK